MRNWSGTITYRAPRYVKPRSIDEVQAVVRAGGRVRALGTRHSFNALPDTDGTAVSVTSIPPAFELAADRGTVELGAGTRYGALAAFLQQQGLALHNMGSLPHISVGGAVSTGTHGSGDLNGNLSTAVRSITFVDAAGDLRTLQHEDAEFSGSVVALGALGVLVRITLAVQPSYLVRQDVYRDLAWDKFLRDPASITGAAYSVSVFTDWVSPTIPQVWLKRVVSSDEEVIPADLQGAVRDGARAGEKAAVDDNTTQHGIAGPWSERLPHFRFDREPSIGDEIQTEYFVDAANASDALKVVKQLGPEIAPHLVISEIRTAAADDLWLSPAYLRPAFGIHFTWLNRPDAVLALLPRIERALAPFDARPHWGKLHTMTAEHLAGLYPRFDDMRALIRRRDPNGMFGGPELERLLGPRV